MHHPKANKINYISQKLKEAEVSSKQNKHIKQKQCDYTNSGWNDGSGNKIRVEQKTLLDFQRKSIESILES